TSSPARWRRGSCGRCLQPPDQRSVSRPPESHWPWGRKSGRRWSGPRWSVLRGERWKSDKGEKARQSTAGGGERAYERPREAFGLRSWTHPPTRAGGPQRERGVGLTVPTGASYLGKWMKPA